MVAADCTDVRRIPVSARRRTVRRVPLIVSFAGISLALTIGLAAVLSVMIDHTINEHSVRALKNSTTTAVAVASKVILADAPTTSAQQMSMVEKLREVALMNTAAKVLRETGSSVASEALLPDGTVIGGVGGAKLGSKDSIDQGFRDALAGKVVSRILHSSHSAATSAL